MSHSRQAKKLTISFPKPTVWDSKPNPPGAPINWVELKTSAEFRGERDLDNFDRKLMKFWIQSFLLGVPKIIVGFRSPDGILVRVQEYKTEEIPSLVKRRGRVDWDGNVCINFASAFLECMWQVLVTLVSFPQGVIVSCVPLQSFLITTCHLFFPVHPAILAFIFPLA